MSGLLLNYNFGTARHTERSATCWDYTLAASYLLRPASMQPARLRSRQRNNVRNIQHGERATIFLWPRKWLALFQPAVCTVYKWHRKADHNHHTNTKQWLPSGAKRQLVRKWHMSKSKTRRLIRMLSLTSSSYIAPWFPAGQHVHWTKTCRDGLS